MLKHSVPAPSPSPEAARATREADKRALVTGASGFIGRHLVRRLVREGWQVAVTVRATSRPPADVVASCALIEADAIFEELVWSVQRFAPSVCFHLATHFSNGSDGVDIETMVESNLTFGSRLLEAFSRCGGVAVVNAGSRMQHYGAVERRPVSYYAATKQAFAEVLAFYADVKGVPAVTVEFPDTYGPDDPRPKLLPLLRRAAASGDELLMSPGEQIIEIVHVDDAVDALLTAHTFADLTAPTFSVPGDEMPLRQFVAEVERALGRRVPVAWGARPYRDREMMGSWAYWPGLPGWSPRTSLTRGLSELVRGHVVALTGLE